MAVDAGVVEQPVNGIYQIPSLRNMTKLKTLRFFPRLRSNLDAIVYITHAGLLVPLQKLVLCIMKTDKEQEMAKYLSKEGLQKVHKEVEFVTHH